MSHKFSVEAVFTAVDQFSGPVSSMSASMNKLDASMRRGGGPLGGVRSAADRASEAWGRMDSRFSVAKTNMLVAGTAGALAAHKMVSAGADIEDALLQGSSKFGDGIRRNTPEFKKLEAAALDLGRNTKFGAVEAAGALNDLAASGFTPDAAIKNLPTIAKMAIAGGEELQQASTIALDALGNFGLLYDNLGKLRGPDELAKSLSRVADVIAYTANQTTASMGSIYETMTEAGPIADIAGMSFEKFAAITGALAQAGIKGSVAGTAIKNISVRLLSPTTEGKKELQRLKIDEKAFRKMSDPLEQLEVIAKAIDKLPKDEKVKAIDEYFGKIPLAAAGYLLKGGFRNARELESKIHQNAPGTNDAQANIIADSTRTKMTELNNAFERIGKTIFDKIQQPLDSTIDRAIQYLDANQDKFADKAKASVEWVSQNGEAIGDALKWGAYGFAGAQGLKVIHSLVTFGKDLGSIAAGAVNVATKLGGATTAVNTFVKTASMGRLGFTLAGAGAGAGAAATGGLLLADYANDGLKDSTEGLGILDLIGGAFKNTWNGDERGIMGVIDDHQNKLARARARQQELQDAYAGRVIGESPMSAMMATDSMAQALNFLKDPKMGPILIPKEEIASKLQPINVQPIVDALALHIATMPQVVSTEDRLARAIQEQQVETTSNAEVHVRAEPGTSARTVRKGTHTRVNNHRNGTN